MISETRTPSRANLSLVVTENLAGTPARSVENGPAEDPSFTAGDLQNVGLILLLCCAFGYLRWLKVGTLLWGDPSRWLFEAQRVAAGQVPYRDFSWSYPPFSVLLLGGAMKVFGVSFTVAQVFLDLWSFAVIFLAYAVIRPLLPRFLHLPVMFFLVAVCGTSLMFFNLFSFLTYVPALQTGAVGLLLLLVGLRSYVRTGELSASTWLLITIGAFIAAYSKLESLMAAYAILGLLAIVDRKHWFAERKTGDWFRHYTKLAAACVAPALAGYIWIGAITGFANLKEGLLGYGVAGSACPWWPTGLGLFGAAASLGEAAFVAAVFSLTRRKRFAARFGADYYYALTVGLAGVCIYVAYVFYVNWSLLSGGRPFWDKVWWSAKDTIMTNAILLPVMWSGIVLWLFLAYRLILSRRLRPSMESFSFMLALTGAIAMSVRGWFNWHLGVTPTVPALCYPFLLLLGPYLLWRLLALAGPGADLVRGIRSWPGAAMTAVLIGYSLLRVAGGYSSMLSRKPYENLPTMAGNIRLTDYAIESEIYRFIMDNTSAADTVIDIPYGGGINVATHRLSNFFSTMLVDLRMPDRFLDEDLDRIRQRPPKVVIVHNQPNYGAVYGMEGCTCSYPRFVWRPATSSIVPGKVFPAIRYIQENYRVAKVVGPKLLLVPK